MRPAAATRDWRLWAAFLSALYLLAAALAFQRTLIGTEVWALHFATQPIAGQFEEIRRDLVHPPLMYLIERGWQALFGDSDTAVKLLPVPISLATLILFTRLARRVVRHWRLASLLFVAAYLRPDSTEAAVRMYGLLVLFVVVAILLWDRWQQQPTTARLAAWAAVMVLMIYTHYSGLLVLAGFLVLNWLVGPSRWGFTLAAVAAGATFLPWAWFVLPVFESRGIETNLWWVRLLLPQPYQGLSLLLYERLGRFSESREGIYALSAAAAAVHLAVLAPALGSLRRVWPPRRAEDPQRRWFWVAALLAGVPVLLLLLFSIAVTSAFAPRFVTCTLPAYWLLMMLLGELGGRAGRVALFGIVLPWVLFATGLSLYRDTGPGPLRQQASIVARQAAPSDLVLCYDCNSLYWELDHRFGAAVPVRALGPDRRDQGVDLTALPRQPIQEIDLGTPDRIWYFHPGEQIPQADSDALGRAGFRAGNGFGTDPGYFTVLSRPH